RGWAPTLVGGLTLGADPVAYAIVAAAHARGRPLDAFTVRKQAKAHGTGQRIEGCFTPGAAVVVVEDVITTGHSAADAIAAVATDRASLASKIRGWKDDAAGLEQRLKDLETIARSLRRRWWLVGTGLVLGLIGWAVGAVRTRPGTMVLVAGAGLILNALLGMINERGWYRWWLIYALALLDVGLVAVLLVWFG